MKRLKVYVFTRTTGLLWQLIVRYLWFHNHYSIQLCFDDVIYNLNFVAYNYYCIKFGFIYNVKFVKGSKVLEYLPVYNLTRTTGLLSLLIIRYLWFHIHYSNRLCFGDVIYNVKFAKENKVLERLRIYEFTRATGLL